MNHQERGNGKSGCLFLVDDITTDLINGLGGIKTIEISHPHYYVLEWAERLGAKIYLYESDRQWVMYPSETIKFWSGPELSLTSDVKLIQVGGHFELDNGGEREWALLTGDIIQVIANRGRVSFMYSYPNAIPLPA